MCDVVELTDIIRVIGCTRSDLIKLTALENGVRCVYCRTMDRTID